MSSLFNGSMGQSGVDTGDIGHSLRFRRSASCYLNKTPPAAGNRLVWTYSVWFKRGELGTDQMLLDAGLDGNNESAIWINTSNKLDIYNYVGASHECRRVTTAVLRDPTSWNHLVVSSNGTTHFKIYLNGVELTAFDTTTGTNGTNWFFNSSSYVMYSGRRFNATNYFDGEKARECWVADSALTPSSFGYFNTEINEWVTKTQSQVKAVVDAGGTNSFMLDFDDATSLTTLGYDKSTKGNNWTLNNFSLTAGTTYDHMLDVPGNSFATLNPLDNVNMSNTLVEANCALTTPVGANYGPSLSSYEFSAGKWYCEFQSVSGDSTPSAMRIGITKTRGVNDYLGSQTGDVSYQGNGNKVVSNVYNAYGATFGTTGDVIGIAVDMDAGTVEFFKNGTSQGQAATGISGSYVFAIGDATSIGGVYKWAINSGQYPFQSSATYHSAAGGYFRYAPPTGYKALCQRNMPDPAILNPEKHFDVVTYTGTAATKSITGLGFPPDLVEMKSRGRAVDWAYYDSVRGVEKRLESNNTDAEVTGDTTGLTAFNSDGWTMGALDQINGTTATNSFVGFAWKAGGAAVTNNAGSISSQVSANVTAGFSIVTYTGTGANATVGHGLGRAPGLVVVKGRNTTAASNWPVWHRSLNGGAPTNYVLFLNLTNAQGVNGTYSNSADPSSTVVSLGTAAEVNENTKNYVAYCFAEIEGFSKAFSYTGNGSADGPYVHCGFKPKYVLIKASSAAEQWGIIDSVRSPDNPSNEYLIPNSANAEDYPYLVDTLSNGFKPRVGAGYALNANGTTYIGIAFADVPAKYSLAR